MGKSADQTDWIGEIDGGTAKHILRILAAEPLMKGKISELAKALLADVRPQDVASWLCQDLEWIDPQEVWERSETHGAFPSVRVVSYEAVRDELDEYLSQMEQLRRLGMREAERSTFLGILKGMQDFARSDSALLGEMADFPDDLHQALYEDWKQAHPEETCEDAQEMIASFPW